MTDLDDRLSSAWADLSGQPVGSPEPEAFVRRRRRARTAARSGVLGLAVLVGVAGVAAVPLADSDETAEVATWDTEAQSSLEATLLEAGDLGEGWQLAPGENMTQSADGCAAEVVGGAGAIGEATRSFVRGDVVSELRMAGQMTLAYPSDDAAGDALSAFGRVLERCEGDADGGTIVDVEPAALDVAGDRSLAYRGTVPTAAGTSDPPGTAWIALVQVDDRLTIVFDVTIAGPAPEPGEVEAIVRTAASKL